jgi:putative transposase
MDRGPPGRALDTQYFHVVFTVPDAIAAIALQNKARVYGILFRTAAETLRTIAADPQHLGAAIGFFAVLHTWGQNLLHHPHVHCVVLGGRLSPDGTRWISCRPGFFLPVRVLSRLFRRLFLEALDQAFAAGDLRFSASLEVLHDPQAWTEYLASARTAEWVVYAKPPFGGPRQVLDYVGRYTHRVAIANQRLVAIADGQVSFRWKDYRDGRQKTMTLTATEFIRRFLLHVLPDGFHRIRYYGFLGNRYRHEKLARCQHLLGMTPLEVLPEETFVAFRLSRPLRGPDRGLPLGMPRLSSGSHAPGRDAGAGRRLDHRHLMISTMPADTLTGAALDQPPRGSSLCSSASRWSAGRLTLPSPALSTPQDPRRPRRTPATPSPCPPRLRPLAIQHP